MMDQYFNYKYRELEYRGLRFEHEVLDVDNYQGNAVVNYTEREVPYTRITEHKYFEFGQQEKQLSPENIQQIGSGVMSLTTQSTTRKTMPSLLAMPRKLRLVVTALSSVAA